MNKFKKKPVTVDAIQWTVDNFVAIDEFITCYHETLPKDEIVKIHTLEGVMTASKNDWIIKGVNGEFYPCKPDIFEKTYSPLDTDSVDNSENITDSESEESLIIATKTPVRELEIGTKKFTKVLVHDEKGAGGACHEYTVESVKEGYTPAFAIVKFQDGPILESGANGCHNEDLIAIVIDRLQGFQSGEFSCRENAVAITKLQEALMWLRERTMNREARGVEGTSVK